eukprot:scaffold53098_cov35-Phaeocystis_antarctica.AAC.2
MHASRCTPAHTHAHWSQGRRGAEVPRRRTVHDISEGPRQGCQPGGRCRPRGGAAPRIHMVDAWWMHSGRMVGAWWMHVSRAAPPSRRCSAASVPSAPTASERSTTLYAISPREVLICGGGGRGGSGGWRGPAYMHMHMCLRVPA